jgi:hypothetical protein
MNDFKNNIALILLVITITIIITFGITKLFHLENMYYDTSDMVNRRPFSPVIMTNRQGFSDEEIVRRNNYAKCEELIEDLKAGYNISNATIIEQLKYENILFRHKSYVNKDYDEIKNFIKLIEDENIQLINNKMNDPKYSEKLILNKQKINSYTKELINMNNEGLKRAKEEKEIIRIKNELKSGVKVDRNKLLYYLRCDCISN